MATTTVTVPIPIVQTSGGFFKIVVALCLLLSLLWFIRKFYMTMMTQSQPAPPPAAPTGCIKTGLSSSTKDGSDCCTRSMDFNNVCQPKPGQPSSSLGAPMS